MENDTITLKDAPHLWLMRGCVESVYRGPMLDPERQWPDPKDPLFVSFLEKSLIDLLYEFGCELKTDQLRILTWRFLQKVNKEQTNRYGGDGTERLVRVLHNRKDRAQDWLGGADAKMLHEAANALNRQAWQITDLKMEAARANAHLELAIAGFHKLKSLVPEEKKRYMQDDHVDVLLVGANEIHETIPEDPSETEAVARKDGDVLSTYDPVWALLETENFWVVEGAGTSRYLILKSECDSVELRPL